MEIQLVVNMTLHHVREASSPEGHVRDVAVVDV